MLEKVKQLRFVRKVQKTIENCPNEKAKAEIYAKMFPQQQQDPAQLQDFGAKSMEHLCDACRSRLDQLLQEYMK